MLIEMMLTRKACKMYAICLLFNYGYELLRYLDRVCPQIQQSIESGNTKPHSIQNARSRHDRIRMHRFYRSFDNIEVYLLFQNDIEIPIPKYFILENAQALKERSKMMESVVGTNKIDRQQRTVRVFVLTMLIQLQWNP